MSNKEDSSYKNIFKATTLFGGVQIYQIIIQVIRSKFVAVLLGTTGVGLQGLYQSTLSLIQSITSLGLAQSSVRDVSEANGSGDLDRIAKTVSALRKLVWFTGLLGMVAVIVLSPLLSKMTFGCYDYSIPLIVLSFTLFVDQLAVGQRVVLQGMRRLKELAIASAVGATVGLIISVPLFYFFGIKGIVPSFILNSVAVFIIFYYFSKTINLPKVVLSAKETWSQGKWMIRLGVAMSISSLFSAAINYVIRAFIMRNGGTEAVGLYQAGFIIINTYVGMVFSAIGTDFYPRLAAVNKDNNECRRVISQQGEIATHILAPILCGCILLMPTILTVLYSNKFLGVGPFIMWCCPGMMFRLASWLIAFQFMAKADTRLFLFTQIADGVIFLLLSLPGYYLGGMTGLGIAFTIEYFLYFVIVYMIASKQYGFSFLGGFVINYVIQFLLVICALLSIILLDTPINYWICTFFTVISCVYALYILEKKVGYIDIVKKKLTLWR